jgi:hypothetical protein
MTSITTQYEESKARHEAAECRSGERSWNQPMAIPGAKKPRREPGL